MSKFIRFFNQNKKGIIKVIVIIAFTFAILDTLCNDPAGPVALAFVIDLVLICLYDLAFTAPQCLE